MCPFKEKGHWKKKASGSSDSCPTCGPDIQRINQDGGWRLRLLELRI